MTLNRLRLGQRLGLGFALLLALMTLITVLSERKLMQLADELQYLQTLQERATLASEWRAMTGLNMERTMAMAKSNNHPDVEAHYAPLIKATSAKISETQKTLSDQVDSDQGRAILADIADKRSRYVDSRKQVFELLRAQKTEEAAQFVTQTMMPAIGQYDAAIESLVNYQRDRVNQRTTQSASDVQQTQRWLLGLLAGGLVLGALAAWFITRSVTGPLRQAVDETQAIADGDLTRRILVSGQDEISQLQGGLTHMQQSLIGLMRSIQQSSESIGTASSQIAAGNTDLSSRTEQSASKLQETAAASEYLIGTVSQTADAARTATQLASSASEVAQRSGDVVARVVDTMAGISDSSRRIGDIIGVIDGIAFQTNILALNAAVEAARAGEQGRGFAVVASEVRSLAQRSAEAAKEIKSLINASVERVEAGSQLVTEAGQTIREVMDSTQRVTDIINEISAATIEQKSGLANINHSVADLDRITQQNSALVEESAAAAESLKDQASTLVGLTRGFRVN